MAQLRDPVKVRHPKVGGGEVREVPRRSLAHWQKLGWQPVDKSDAVGAAKTEDKGK